MKNLWDDSEAAGFGRSDLEQRVYSSRLLGRDQMLVLHGGGNISVKVTEEDILGEMREVLYVKGSGWDLATIEPAGFSPMCLDQLRLLVALPHLSDAQMSNEVLTHLTVAGTLAPSVEAILHAILPFKFVDHTHVDAFITVSNSAVGGRRLRDIYEDTVVYVRYVMPGFKLCKLCSKLYPAQATGKTVGMVFEHHGLFSFGATAKESFERMIDLVSAAEDYLQRAKVWQIAFTGEARDDDASSLAAMLLLRQRVSEQAGFPMVLLRSTDPVANTFCRRPDLELCTRQGPATHNHVIRTKRLPVIGSDVAGYATRSLRKRPWPRSRSTESMTMLYKISHPHKKDDYPNTVSGVPRLGLAVPYPPGRACDRQSGGKSDRNRGFRPE
jgi:rhamnose utilization protein RhaD (predicted bifunctional aldolase and dehydrogenase)